MTHGRAEPSAPNAVPSTTTPCTRCAVLSCAPQPAGARWAHRSHICAGTGLTPPHICTGTGLTPDASAPGLGSRLPQPGARLFAVRTQGTGLVAVGSCTAVATSHAAGSYARRLCTTEQRRGSVLCRQRRPRKAPNVRAFRTKCRRGSTAAPKQQLLDSSAPTGGCRLVRKGPVGVPTARYSRYELMHAAKQLSACTRAHTATRPAGV